MANRATSKLTAWTQFIHANAHTDEDVCFYEAIALIELDVRLDHDILDAHVLHKLDSWCVGCIHTDYHPENHPIEAVCPEACPLHKKCVMGIGYWSMGAALDCALIRADMLKWLYDQLPSERRKQLDVWRETIGQRLSVSERKGPPTSNQKRKKASRGKT